MNTKHLNTLNQHANNIELQMKVSPFLEKFMSHELVFTKLN